MTPSMRTPAGSDQVQPEECAPLNPPMLSTVGGVRRAGSMLIVIISGRKEAFESNVKNTFDSNVLIPYIFDRLISINDLKMISVCFVDVVNFDKERTIRN